MTFSVAPPHAPRTLARPEDGPATRVVDLTPAPSDPRSEEFECRDWAGSVEKALRTAAETPAPRPPSGSAPPAAPAAAPAAVAFPEVGDEFLGFRLEGELGRGAFGRVYLARQGELAARPVALKVTAKASREPQTLAQLQHTNIVPVYSVHRAGPLQAVCMPYFGSVTLDDVVGGLRGRDGVPGSGTHFVSTLNQRRASTTPGPASAGGTPADPPPAPPGVPRPAVTNEILTHLSGLSYVGAVLWMGARLADGLAHAHDRGVIHRDLKPANVLLTDEGQPMLLDFNLADDANAAPGGPARVGGTLPYMSPEQLELFRTRAGTIDARSDLYSLGLMMYELLAGRHPFPTPAGALARILPQMVADRRAGPPPLRPQNRAVTPAVEAIVRRCLRPDPADRYPSARALREDIERHLADRPLRHTPEPSLRERARKFARRNPRLTSSGMNLGLATVLILGLVGGLFSQRDQLRRREAADGWARFQKDKQRLEVAFGVGAPEPETRAARLAEAERVLGGFGLPDDPAWADRPAVARLSEADRAALRVEMGELLFFTARATALQADRTLPHDGPAARGLLARAALLSERAVECFEVRKREWAVPALRDELRARAAGVRWEGGVLPPPASPKEAYLAAADLVALGRYSDALPDLEYAVREKPDIFAVQYILGNCLIGLGRDAGAEAAYGACVALAPDDPRARRARGRARLRQGNFEGARDDFDVVLRARPTDPEGFLDRAAARHGLGKSDEATADLLAAQRYGAAPARVEFVRAVVFRAIGDAAGGTTDGNGREARRTVGWVVSEKVWRAAGAVRVLTGGGLR
ncbi:MAG: hypothetical protein C0501_04515 [Isosphaera sp.]|nr:hypothetical protein [Isosphaera sp.]